MYGRDVILGRAYPCNLEMVELAAGSCEFHITRRLLGMVADKYAYPLHQHLQPRLGLPSWGQLMYAPQTIPGARFVRHANGYYATVAPLDGAELEVYRLSPRLVGTLYTFDLDYRLGVRLLRGLSWRVLADLSLWFARDMAPLTLTIEQYLDAIAAAPGW
ncbi:MAG: hypothetical protein DLM69_11115 [Candidatus Chloroheliales bacterium]|nr:MAG: hypothetical protein DLM69_11115 [Chloroflexota bacterium]